MVQGLLDRPEHGCRRRRTGDRNVLEARAPFINDANSFVYSGKYLMLFRWTGISLGLVLAVSSFAPAQEPPSGAQTPEDAFSTRELVAWSSLQRPQPAPQPLPPQDTTMPQPGQSSGQQSGSTADQARQEIPIQSYSGRIVRDGSEYVLKAAGDTTYQISEQGGIEKYQNIKVRIIGHLDPISSKIHVLKIEMPS